MLAGMYVTHAGAVHQVRSIKANAPAYTRHPGSVYELQPLDGGQLVYLHSPMAADIPLTPACLDCEAPAGWCPGHPASVERRTA